MVGQRQQQHFLALRLLAKPPRDLVTVHRGKTDVDDSDVWMCDIQELKAADGIGRVVHDVPGELERHLQRLSRPNAVLYQQHASGLQATFAWYGETGVQIRCLNRSQTHREPAAVPFAIARRVD